MTLTIGHSTHALEAFVALLRRHHVAEVVDVRSAPYSRFNPQFNREALARSLAACGIEHVFLGLELGGRSDDPSCYENGRIRYDRLGATQLFQRGLDRVVHDMAGHHIALMCAEKEPLECHRTLLVAQALHTRGVAVGHILADGGWRPTPRPWTGCSPCRAILNKGRCSACLATGLRGPLPSRRNELHTKGRGS